MQLLPNIDFSFDFDNIILVYGLSEVRAISNHKKRYQKATNKREQDLREKTRIEAQIALLEKQRDVVSQRIAEDDNDVVSEGLLYYNQEKREAILNEAEKLRYSQETISRIRRKTGDENWNADNVGIEIMLELDAVDKFVGKNAAWWEKSLLSKFGSLLNQEEEDSP